MAVCPFGIQGPITPWGDFVQIRERVPSSGRMQPVPGCSVWCTDCGCPHGSIPKTMEVRWVGALFLHQTSFSVMSFSS